MAPAVTMERAQTNSWPRSKAMTKMPRAAIAAVPDAAPSRLSKKLMELQMPTIQKMVIAVSSFDLILKFSHILP